MLDIAEKLKVHTKSHVMGCAVLVTPVPIPTMPQHDDNHDVPISESCDTSLKSGL